MKLIPSPPLKSVAALAAVAVFTCMLAASPVRAGAFEEYRAVDMKLQSVREGDAEGLRAAGVLVESFSKRWSKGAASERTMAAYLMLRWGIASGRHQAAYGAALVLLELKPSPEQRPGLLKLAAQLGYQSERFEAVPGHVDAWIEVKGMPRTATERAETAEMMTLAAYALHELGRDRQALARVKEAYGIAPARARGDFVLALCASLGDVKAERAFLPVMVRDWNETPYWSRWGSLVQQAGDGRQALDILSSARKAGRLDERLVPLLLSLVIEHDAPTKALRILEEHPEAWKPEERRMLQTALLVKCGRRAEALELLRKAGDGGAGNGRERMAVELAFAEEDWTGARKGAMRLAESETKPAERDRWRFLSGLCAYNLKDYAGAADLLERDDLSRPGCLVLDIRMPGMTGVELQRRLFDAKCTLPVIFLTGHGDITTAVHTMKYGAADFLEKRGDPLALAGAVERACAKSMAAESDAAEADDYRRTFESLTQREREVFMLAAEGLTNKDVAERLGIGAETVKMHKANAYAKLGVASALDAYRWLENLPADYRAGLAGTGK